MTHDLGFVHKQKSMQEARLLHLHSGLLILVSRQEKTPRCLSQTQFKFSGNLRISKLSIISGVLNLALTFTVSPKM